LQKFQQLNLINEAIKMTISIAQSNQSQTQGNSGLNANYQSNHRQLRIETPDDRRRRELEAQTLEVQRVHQKQLLLRRLNKAEERGDTQLIRELQKEWHELFPYETSIGE
jgi:hypothetical protein